MTGTPWIDKAYRWAIPALGLWLLTWIIISWAGVQDDAFIHLRYADNLFHTHQITYDGVHPNYGASSLLYVYLLAPLHALFASPNLPHAVSTAAHLLLMTGLGVIFFRATPRDRSLSRLTGFILLLLLAGPSAVRWLDDGMETGLALCFVTLLCWTTFRQSIRGSITPSQYAAMVALGFFTVLLRTELILLCCLAFAILSWRSFFNSNTRTQLPARVRDFLSGSHLFLGGLLALLFIRIRMGVLLPDTALAKSDGVAHWYAAAYVTAKVFAGALSFGAGIFLFWLLTIFLLLRAGRFSAATFFANLSFPILFSLAALRGQQIQGARYFIWALFFSILWNTLQLSALPTENRSQRRHAIAFCFLALLLLALPYESKMLYPMLTQRALLSQQLESEHLEVLQGMQGVAFDIGYIGYFSRANICDLAGLVNGRDKARLTPPQRLQSCMATHPDFIFTDLEGMGYAGQYISLDQWQVCGTYDFRNVNQTDRHYLMFPRSTAVELCRQVANASPSETASLFH